MVKDVSLPTELIYAILDHVRISQLVVLSHVCASWRSAARAHPVFWRDIVLSGSSVSAIELFEARIGTHIPGAAITVSIHMHEPSARNTDRLRSIVLPAIAQNLFRIKRLALDLFHLGLAMAYSFLHEPAPILRELALSSRGGRYRIGLPEEGCLFGGSAPELRHVDLTEVIPRYDQPPIRTFHTVESLDYLSHKSVHAPSLLAHFPSLRHLDVRARSCASRRRDTISPSICLETLHVLMESGNYDFYNAFSDLAPIKHLSCLWSTGYSPETTAKILSVFDGLQVKLTLAFHGSMEVLSGWHDAMHRVSFAAHGRTRTFYIEEDYLDVRSAGYPTMLFPDRMRALRYPAMLLPDEMRARITTVRLAADEATLIKLAVLPACETLELELTDDHVQQVLREPVVRPLPALRSVVLTADPAARVAVRGSDLFALLAWIIGPLSAVPAIVQDHFAISGDIAQLKRSYLRPAATRTTRAQLASPRSPSAS